MKRAFVSRCMSRKWNCGHSIGGHGSEATYLSGSSTPGDEAPEEWPDLLFGETGGFISST